MQASATRTSRTAFSRDGLLDVAIDLFASHGFAGTSMRDIAGAAGCSIANVYHHFAGKEAMWIAILDRSVNDMPGRLRVAIDRPLEPLAKVEALIRAHLDLSAEFPRESQILFTGDERRSPEANRASLALQHEVLGLYIATLGELRAADAASIRMTALNVLGVINWHLRWTKAGGSEAARRLEADAVVGFALAGILGGLGGK